jgi:uncharacterized membrane protein YbhN (UPF0104 family)
LKNNKFLNIIKWVWVVAVVAGGIYYVIKNYVPSIQYLQSINVSNLVLSFFLIVIVRLLNVDLVQRSLILIGWKPNFKLAFSLVSLSQLGKYVPGGFWQFVARFGAYKGNQISFKNMGKSFLVENIWLVLGSFLVSFSFIFFSQPTAILQKYGLDLSANIQLILAIGCMALWFLILIIIEFTVKSGDRKPNLFNVCKQFFSQVALWVIFGVSFFLLFSKTGSLDDLLFTIGAFGLSFLAGYVAIFAPGGIGVREYVAVLLFSIIFSSTEIGIYTIIHRLLYTLVEFLLAGIALILSRMKKTPQSEPDNTNLTEEARKRIIKNDESI